MGNFRDEVMSFVSTQVGDAGLLGKGINPVSLTIRKREHHFLIVLHSIREDSFTGEVPNEQRERVIHLWEDQWKFHREKVESRINSLLGLSSRIHGRETVLRSITNSDLISFLETNHLNVPIKGKYKYGLFNQGALTAVMSFSKGRPMLREGTQYNSFELLRFCSKSNTTVVGGFTKLLNHFIKTVHPDDIMTYVDKDWSDGSNYEKAGFTLESELGPMMFLLNPETGERLYPHRVQISDNEKGESKSSESEISDSFLKVYNSGSYKFVLLLKKS